MVHFEHPVLAIRNDLFALDSEDAPSTLWQGINHSKGFIQEGDRLVNISWRLWHLQLAARHIVPPSPPSSVSSGSTASGSDGDDEWTRHPDSPVPKRRRKSHNSLIHRVQASPVASTSSNFPPTLHRTHTQSTIASSAPTSPGPAHSHPHSQSLPPPSSTLCFPSIYRPRSVPAPASHLPGASPSEFSKKRSPGRRIPIGRIIHDILPLKLDIPPPKSRLLPLLVEPDVVFDSQQQQQQQLPTAPHPTPLLHPPNPTLILINPTPRPTPPTTPHTARSVQTVTHLSATYVPPKDRAIAPVLTPIPDCSPAPAPVPVPPRMFSTLPRTDSNSSNSTASTEEEEERAMKGIFFIHKSSPGSSESPGGVVEPTRENVIGVTIVAEVPKKEQQQANKVVEAKKIPVEEVQKQQQQQQPSPPPPSPTKVPEQRLPRTESTEAASVSSKATRSTKGKSTDSVREYKGKTAVLRRPAQHRVNTANKRTTRPTTTRRSSSHQQVEQHPSPSLPAPVKAPSPPPPPPPPPPVRRRTPEPEFESTSSSWSSDSSPPLAPPSRQQQQFELAALEAARQRDMFTKLPPRSYSNLGKSDGEKKKAGMLSMLLNPEPNILATLQATKSTGNLMGVSGLGANGRSSGWGMPGMLKGSKSAAEVRVAPVSVTASQMPQISQKLTENGGRGYRLKGRPEGTQVEMETTDDEDEDEPVPVVGSVAQRRLEAFRRGTITSNASGSSSLRKQGEAMERREDGPSLIAQQPTRDEDLSTRPLPFPYNLPAPQAPQTPRTTRRQMLSTEISESMRRQLLWERESTKRGLMQGLVKVKSAANVRGPGGLKPLTKLDEAERKKEEEERRERTKLLEKRTKSWSEEYHATGW